MSDCGPLNGRTEPQRYFWRKNMNNKKHSFKTPILLLVVLVGACLAEVAAAHTRPGAFNVDSRAIARAPESLSLPATSLAARDSIQAIVRDLNRRNQAGMTGTRGETTLIARRARHHQHLRFVRELRKAKGKKPNV
jgi:hypothetical protein